LNHSKNKLFIHILSNAVKVVVKGVSEERSIKNVQYARKITFTNKPMWIALPRPLSALKNYSPTNGCLMGTGRTWKTWIIKTGYMMWRILF
jgi:hypothetical protein